MRSYTNRKGERVRVDKTHLDTAVEIKIQLQKSSPSGNCSWAQLVKLMSKEGFDDAENSENYRCLIKSYQRSIGKLPSVEKHADMLADNKLESIKEMVGDLAYSKREAQNAYRELNKVKREVIDKTLMIEEVARAFNKHDFSSFSFTDNHIEKSSDSEMVVVLSDMHIGALVDTNHNKFNLEIAKKRLQKFLNEIISKCESDGITNVYVVNLGDTVEHANMRHNQGYSIEFDYSSQIVIASDLIIKFLLQLKKSGLNVTYSGISGNHDRLNGDKDKNLDGDSAVKAINYTIKIFIENSEIENITYEQADSYKHCFEVNGLRFLALHGDLDNKNDLNIINKHSILDGVEYDVVLMGHYHTLEMVEITKGKYLFVNSSLKGSDNYSVDKLRKASSASQSFYIVDKDGKISMNWVEF